MVPGPGLDRGTQRRYAVAARPVAAVAAAAWPAARDRPPARTAVAAARAHVADGAVAAVQTGRGKKDEKDVTQEHLAFADEESWLDDEGANDSVID